MLLEFKREQQKFEVMEEEICNQQKEIENLRQLILSTNFMNQNPAARSSIATIGSTTNSFSSTFASTSSKRPGKETKQLNADLVKSKASSKAKAGRQTTSQQVKSSLVNRSAGDFKQFGCDQRCSQEPDTSKPMDRRLPTGKPKGLQTINKNVLNQKNSKYSNDKFGKSSEPKKDDLIKKADDQNLIQLNDDPVAGSKSDELLSRITKLKSFENQENPIKECLGINKSSKGINKKARQVKSSLKATKSSSSINRIHLL